MHSQSMIEYGAPLVALDAETPQPKGREVVLRVHNCGVCHSDLHIHDGHFAMGTDDKLDVRSGRNLPFILGHEIEAEVVALGPDADGTSVGDHRVVFPWIGCGTCPACKRHEEVYCDKPHHLGITADGGFATHVVVPDSRYLIDAAEIDPAFAGACMCSGLTAYSALRKLEHAARKGPLLIVGLGGVGMMALRIARALFDTPIFAADIDPAKRDAALREGAAAAFDPAEREARRALIKQSGGAAAAADFAGAEGSFAFAQSSLRKGGHVVVAGLIGGRFSMALPMLPLRGITIEGSFVGTLDEARELIALIRSQRIAPIPIEKRPLEEANRSMDDLRKGKVVGRIVLQP